ncbi:MAG: hypothetical protein RIQ52_1744 [Pseudomonadota bacterium]
MLLVMAFSERTNAAANQKLLFTIDWTTLAGYTSIPTDGYEVQVNVQPLLNGGALAFVQEVQTANGTPLTPPATGYMNYINNKGKVNFKQELPYKVEENDCESQTSCINNNCDEGNTTYLYCPQVSTYSVNISGQPKNTLIYYSIELGAAHGYSNESHGKSSTYILDTSQSTPNMTLIAQDNQSNTWERNYNITTTQSEPNTIVINNKKELKTKIYSLTFK